MVEYQCFKCNYKFEAHKRPLTCPYCGNTDTVHEVPKASDFLKDIAEEETISKKRHEREEQ